MHYYSSRIICCQLFLDIWPRITLFIISVFQSEKIQTILKAANVDVEPYWPGLFAKALEGVNPKDLITNVGSGVGAAAPAAGGAGTILRFHNISLFFNRFH